MNYVAYQARSNTQLTAQNDFAMVLQILSSTFVNCPNIGQAGVKDPSRLMTFKPR
jgi:hypothetical protein